MQISYEIAPATDPRAAAWCERNDVVAPKPWCVLTLRTVGGTERAEVREWYTTEAGAKRAAANIGKGNPR